MNKEKIKNFISKYLLHFCFLFGLFCLFGCKGGKAAQAAGIALAAAGSALGPVGRIITKPIIDSLSKDKSPEGQAQYQAAIEYNKTVNSQNAERQQIIEQFVKDAVAGMIGSEEIKFGDVALKEYGKLVSKYGEDFRYLTLAQAVNKYPEETKPFVEAVASIFPEMRGKSFNEMWSLVPDAIRNSPLIDLEKVLPNSSWLGSKTSTGQPVTSGSTLAIGGGLLLAAIGVVAFMFTKKGGSNAPRT